MKIFENIKNKLSNIFLNKNLNFLEVGDIIWAKRYSNEKERIAIEEGHQQGPFIIIHKEDNKVYGLYCTSSTKKDTNKLHYIILDKNQYKLKLFKTTYIKTTYDQEIKYNQFIKKVGHLTEKDLSQLFKVIAIMRLKEPHTLDLHIPDSELKYNIEIGDIIRYKKATFLVVDIDNTSYHVYNANETLSKKGNVSYNGKKFSLSFNTLSKIARTEPVTIEYMIDYSQFKDIMEQKEQHLNLLEERKNIKRGCIVKYNSVLYVIYGEYKDSWQAYKIYPRRPDDTRTIKIILGHHNYYTTFEETLISKEENLSFSRIADEEELAQVKYFRKSSKAFLNPEPEKEVKKTSFQKLLELSKQQEVLVLKLKSFKFSEFEIISIMINIHEKYQIEKILDFISKAEKENRTLNKQILTEQLVKISKK